MTEPMPHSTTDHRLRHAFDALQRHDLALILRILLHRQRLHVHHSHHLLPAALICVQLWAGDDELV